MVKIYVTNLSTLNVENRNIVYKYKVTHILFQFDKNKSK